MRNNKMKGFTLVELLVVIAILAILATVSVVGYTSYIESTTIKVDEDLAAQLNNFLATVKADYDGEYFEELSKNGVTADNVVEITNYILSTGGVDSLTPKSADYGYHFYFDLVDQKYMLIGDKDERINGQSRFGMLINGLSSTQTAHPELAVGKDNRYFLIETGTDLADLIAEFKAITSAEELNTYFDKVSAYENDAKQKLVGLIALVKETVFTTNNGHFIVSGTENHKHLFVQNDLVVSNKNNHEKMSVNGSAIITKDAPLVTLQENQTIVLSLADGVTLAKHSFWFADGSKATLVIDGINTLEELITRVDVDFTNANIVVGGKTYTVTGPTFKDAEGNTVTDESGEPLKIDEKNKVKNFSYSVTGAANKVNGLFIAIDGGEFTLSTDNFEGLLNNEVSTKEVRWTIASVYTETIVDGETVRTLIDDDIYKKYISIVEYAQNTTLTITLNANEVTAPEIDGIVINANSVIGTEESAKEIDLKVVRMTGATGVKLGSETLNLDGSDKLTFINVPDANTNANSKFNLVDPTVVEYNYTNSGVTLDVNASIVLPTVAADETAIFDDANNKVLALAAGVDEVSAYKTITIKIANLLEQTVNVRILSSKNLNFSARTDNGLVKLVGDDNAITLGDIFNKNPNMDIPEGAQIWFGKGFSGTDSAPKDLATGEHKHNDYASVTAVNINTANWAATEISFKDGEASKEDAEVSSVYISIVIPNDPTDVTKGGRRISSTRVLSVVDGYNIDAENYATVIANASESKSFVLWSDITMTSDKDHITVKNLYGNNFKYDITAGAKTALSGFTGVIDFHGTIRDIKIVGAVYPQVALQVDTSYGTPAVCACSTNSKVINSYIANCRAPLRLNKNCTVEDSVFFGGRYANIDIVGGTLTVKGHVVTIQQKVDAPDGTDVLGMGIATWFNDNYKYVVVESGANLEQLNFISSSDTSAMPTITLRAEDIKDIVDLSKLHIPNLTDETVLFNIMNSSTVFGNILGDTANYGAYFFNHDINNTPSDSTDDIRYLNSGMTSIDKYLVPTKDVTVNSEKDGDGWFAKEYVTAAKIKLSGGANATATITYKTDKYTCPKYDPEGTGTFTIDFTTNKEILLPVKTAKSIEKSWNYDVNNDVTVTITTDRDIQFKINNNAGMVGYGNTEYPVTADVSNIIWGVINSALAGKGIHDKTIVLDIWTPKAADNTNLLNTYLGAVAEGTYLPTAGAFDENGNINFYVYTAPVQGETNQ